MSNSTASLVKWRLFKFNLNLIYWAITEPCWGHKVIKPRTLFLQGVIVQKLLCLWLFLIHFVQTELVVSLINTKMVKPERFLFRISLQSKSNEGCSNFNYPTELFLSPAKGTGVWSLLNFLTLPTRAPLALPGQGGVVWTIRLPLYKLSTQWLKF